MSLEVAAYDRSGTLLGALPKAKGKKLLDEFGALGNLTAVMQNTDTDLAFADFDSVLRFSIGGTDRFAGLIEGRDVVAIARGEEHDQTTTLTGGGALKVLAEEVVQPSRGVDALPIEQVRSFFWGGPDFDHSSWGFAAEIQQQSVAGPLWTDAAPESWPDPTAFWIWADDPAVSATDAPEGVCLFHRALVLADPYTVTIFAAFDNLGELYLDGAQVMQGTPDFVKTRRVGPVTLSAGTHHLAAFVSNGSGGDPDINPAGFMLSMHPTSPDGLLDAPILHTDSSWSILPYVTDLPNVTLGTVLIKLVEEGQTLGAFGGVTFDFDEELDSAGNAWNPYFHKIDVQVGQPVLEALQALAETMCDINMTPDLVLQAWNFGERGVETEVVLEAGVNLTALRHTGRRTRTNALLVDYAGGRVPVKDQDSIDTHGRHGDSLQLGHVQTEAEAVAIATETLALRSQPSYATSGTLVGVEPYVEFGVGDWVTCPNEDGDPELMRVRSISLEETTEGVLVWSVELRDRVMEAEERHEAWLRRAAAGMLFGGSRVASPVKGESLTDEGVSSVSSERLSFEGAVPDGTAVALLLNGTSVASVTFGSGDSELRDSIALTKVYADSDRLQMSVGGVVSQAITISDSMNLLKWQVTRTAAADGTEGVVGVARGI